MDCIARTFFSFRFAKPRKKAGFVYLRIRSRPYGYGIHDEIRGTIEKGKKNIACIYQDRLESRDDEIARNE